MKKLTALVAVTLGVSVCIIPPQIWGRLVRKGCELWEEYGYLWTG